MNVLYTTDDRFVPQVAASMCSVMENNRGADELTFYLFTRNVQVENLDRLAALAAGYGRNAELIPIGEISGYFDFNVDTSGWNPIVLARLLLDRLLPETVSRILYLDGDTIVLRDLSSLWNADMSGKPVGGCMETTVDPKRKAGLELEALPYINAGVLLIDLAAWRQRKTGEAIIRYYQKNNGRLFANDQDAINGCLKDQIYLLPLSYNWCNTYQFYPYSTLKRLAAPAPFPSREEFQDQVSHPAIIHYLGEERPWREGNPHRYREEYQKYLAMTPFHDTPMEQGWRGYFVCWRVFNGIMKPFPMLRYRIINGLIPAFMRYRAGQRKKE